ncbi:MAG: hypothetical protein JWM44_2247 [Bacilli bacterium]|nr:hypothetical protein [Bacilli bacterium]
MRDAWITSFAAPSFFVVGLTLIVFHFIRGLQLKRSGRLSAYRKFRIKSKWSEWVEKWLEKEEVTKSGRRLKEKLKLAGNPWGLSVLYFQGIKLCLVLLATFYYVMLFFLRFIVNHRLGDIPIFQYTAILLFIWFIPDLLLILLARRRKTMLLFEISRFSHRLTLCITEKAELREVIMRAGRTLKVLKPYLLELSIQWNKNQYEAILQLGRQVGITEIYPLINTLVAVSNVESTEVAKMLEQQVDNIDKTLEHEIQKKIENAPLLIIFLIMIPFLVVFVLMIYPWIAYLSDQLSTSFGGDG